MANTLNPNFILLYVNDVERSEDFYNRLLDRKPVESSATFAMFPLSGENVSRDASMFLGLWRRDTIEPAATPAVGGSEFAFVVETPGDVGRLHDKWRGNGVSIIQSPTTMDFGTTFTATDPDGHRIRVFARAG